MFRKVFDFVKTMIDRYRVGLLSILILGIIVVVFCYADWFNAYFERHEEFMSVIYFILTGLGILIGWIVKSRLEKVVEYKKMVFDAKLKYYLILMGKLNGIELKADNYNDFADIGEIIEEVLSGPIILAEESLHIRLVAFKSVLCQFHILDQSLRNRSSKDMSIKKTDGDVSMKVTFDEQDIYNFKKHIDEEKDRIISLMRIELRRL